MQCTNHQSRRRACETVATRLQRPRSCMAAAHAYARAQLGASATNGRRAFEERSPERQLGQQPRLQLQRRETEGGI